MKFLELPSDIIAILPDYLCSIYDLYSLLLTCRSLHSAYRDRDIDIKLPPILPKLDGQPLFQPHPHLLLTGVARQLGDWAFASPSNRYDFYHILLDGYDGLLSLAERVTRVSLSDVRSLHEMKYSLLNPLKRLVDFEVGPAMVWNQDMDPTEYGLTICLFPDLAVLNYVVYCELFHLYVDDILASPETFHANQSSRSSMAPTSSQDLTSTLSLEKAKSLDPGIRHRFIAYCLPDKNNHRHRNHESLGKKGRDDEWQLLDYIQMSQSTAMARRNETLKKYWETGILQPIPEDSTVNLDRHGWDWRPNTDEKREVLFINVAGHLGWDSLKMLLLDGFTDESVKAKLKDARDKVQAIPKELIDRWQYGRFPDEAIPQIILDGQAYHIHWHEWVSMTSDCQEGISTNMEQDEDLRAEEDACDSLLKLAMSLDRLGLVNDD